MPAADADSGNMYGYRMSKAALNMATKVRSVNVACVHMRDLSNNPAPVLAYSALPPTSDPGTARAL